MKEIRIPYAVVFTYALAGFGHLRVTDALRDGFKKDIPTYLYASPDISLTTIHRITSIHPVARAFAEWVQRSHTMENIFASTYRRMLTSDPERISDNLMQFLKTHGIHEKHLVVVATHFGLAHQLAVVKPWFLQHGIRLTLIVQVTDDSPQHIWYVPGADYTFVPSVWTKETLEKYGKKHRLEPTKIIVLPYPVSPILSKTLPPSSYAHRLNQYDPESQTPINVVVPLSGAAVALEYYRQLLPKLHALSPRFFFHVIAKEHIYTRMFLRNMRRYAYVRVHSRKTDKGAVDLYEQVYKDNTIAFEITKPSEQAFKALLSRRHVGGSILLFSDPVGRQEDENLAFFRRHERIPTIEEQKELWKSVEHRDEVKNLGQEALRHVSKWRGVLLPIGTDASAAFISMLLRRRIFSEMGKTMRKNRSPELGSGGVEQFWDMVCHLCAKDLQQHA